MSSDILLSWTWNPLSAADSIDKIRIYYRKSGAIPLQYDFTGLALDSVVLTPVGRSDTMYKVQMLDEMTRYHFGAQVYRNGMWSYVTLNSISTDSTGSAMMSTIHNTLKIKPVVFDQASNQLQVSWTVEEDSVTRLTDSLFVGYSCSINGNALNTTVSKTDAVKGLSGSATLDLGDSLLFNTDYYVFLWLKKVNQQWAPPTSGSTGMVHTPAFVWQTVHYRFTAKDGGDTSLWVNGNVRFVTPKVDPLQVGTIAGKVAVFTDATTGLAGFINAGQCFQFSDKQQSGVFEIGLKSSLPDSLKTTFIYRFDAASGKWFIDASTKRDTVNGYVYTLTNQLEMPFAALIDTQPPAVLVKSRSTAPVNKGAIVRDTILVSDNVGNLKWLFQCVKGGEPYSRGTRVDAILTNGVDTAEVSIPGNYTTDDNGAVASFIGDDGRYRVTIDLSRQVIKLNDARVTSPLKWMPMRVTAVLEAPQAENLLKYIDSSKAPAYDDKYIRLFRRYPHASNLAKRDRWVEYKKVPDSIFDFISGRLMWMKTRESVVIDLGRGVTMPQTGTTTVPLFAREWTDFALPYRFNMCVGDIIAATRGSGAYADSLQIYSWVKDSTGRFGPMPLYISTLSGHDSLKKTMSCVGESVGFTVYNPADRQVDLVIPPISDLMSSYTGGIGKNATGAAGNRWAIQVQPRTADGMVLTPVCCGYTANRFEGKIIYPVAPGFDGIGVCVFDEKSGSAYGHKMATGALNGGGCSYLLKFSNDSKTGQTIICSLGRTGAFPSSMKVATFNSQTRETTPLLPGTDKIAVSVDGESSEYRWLLVGDAQYIATAAREHPVAKLALTSVYPNPIRRFAHLLYTLPFGKVATVDFAVVDLMGKTIWNKSIKESSIAGGRRDYVWYGTTMNGRRVAAGVYFLSMTARGSSGRIVGVFDRRLTVLP